jgi:O-antigen ligase
VPILFSTGTGFTKRNYERMFSAFTVGLLLACLICLGHSAFIYSKEGQLDVFFFYQLTSIINLQPTYMAYYLIFSITFLIYSLYYDRVRIQLIFPVTALLILFIMLLLTGGLTSMISLIFIFSFFVLKFLQEKRQSGKRLSIALVFFMIIGMFTTNCLSDKNAAGLKNDYWERSVLWESAIKATPNILWGVGTGDFEQILNQYYQDHNLSGFATSNTNSHNEFTQVLFSNGLPGLFGLLLLMGRPLYLSVVRRNILGILTFFPFFIYGVTEVFLGRYQGVIFFMFLHQVFIAHYLSMEPPLSIENR